MKKYITNILSIVVDFLDFASSELPSFLQIISCVLIFALLINIWDKELSSEYTSFFIKATFFIVLYLLIRGLFFIQKKQTLSNKKLHYLIFFILIVISGFGIIDFLIKVILPISIEQSIPVCIESGHCKQN